MFIHDALNEYITCGETEITANNLRAKFNHLSKQIPGKGMTGFISQFQVSQISDTVRGGAREWSNNRWGYGSGRGGVLIVLFLSQLLDQVSRQPEEEDCSDANEHFNRSKNRYPDKLPCEFISHSKPHYPVCHTPLQITSPVLASDPMEMRVQSTLMLASLM